MLNYTWKRVNYVYIHTYVYLNELLYCVRNYELYGILSHTQVSLKGIYCASSFQRGSTVLRPMRDGRANGRKSWKAVKLKEFCFSSPTTAA